MPPGPDYIHLLFTLQKEDGSSVIRNVIYIMHFIFMVNAKKQQGQELQGEKGAGKIIDFTFWTVLILVGCEKDGVIDTSVSCEDAC